MRPRVSRPSIPGSQTSSRTTSYVFRASSSRQASPVSTAVQRNPSSFNAPPRESRIPGSSSTISTRVALKRAPPLPPPPSPEPRRKIARKTAGCLLPEFSRRVRKESGSQSRVRVPCPAPLTRNREGTVFLCRLAKSRGLCPPPPVQCCPAKPLASPLAASSPANRASPRPRCPPGSLPPSGTALDLCSPSAGRSPGPHEDQSPPAVLRKPPSRAAQFRSNRLARAEPKETEKSLKTRPPESSPIPLHAQS